MAQTVSDEELQAKRDRAAKLREQIAAEEQKLVTRQREQQNAIEAARLDAEVARLETQLATTREAAKASNVRDSNDTVILNAKEQMKLAEQQAAAVKGDGVKGAGELPPPEETVQNNGDKG